MAKKVLNNEEIQKKQQKQFSIGLCIGFMLFIFFIIFVESDFLRNKINVNSNFLKTPNIINVNNKDQGLELERLTQDYKVFIDKIESLNLKNLEDKEFLKEKDVYQYVDENYKYTTNDNYLKLTRKDESIYSISIEDDLTKIELNSDKTYVLEYSLTNISFKVDTKIYSININNNQYLLECNYKMDNYQLIKEIYDNEWNFINVKLLINEIEYTGYFMDDLTNYSLSADKLEIIKDNGESIPSSKYLIDNTTLYYTIMSYEFNDSKIKDLLIVNSNEEFPLN